MKYSQTDFTVILILFVRCNHEISMVKYAKPNQKLGKKTCLLQFVDPPLSVTYYLNDHNVEKSTKADIYNKWSFLNFNPLEINLIKL